jgi:O-antigen/teichoic acid export membrane protein
LADRIIVLLYGQEFVSAIPVMRILVWALPAMFMAEILGRTSSTMHLEKRMARITIIKAVVTAGLNVLLISGFGIVGAAVAAVVTGALSVVLPSIVIGPAMLWKGNVGPVMRVVGAGALMGFIVWQLRDAYFLAALDEKIALLLTIGAGAVVYSLAALVLGAVSPSETRYVYDLIKRKLRGLGRDR